VYRAYRPLAVRRAQQASSSGPIGLASGLGVIGRGVTRSKKAAPGGTALHCSDELVPKLLIVEAPLHPIFHLGAQAAGTGTA
jgi:hypothetical protein